MAQPSGLYDVYHGEIGQALANGSTAKTIAKDNFRNAVKATIAAPVAIPIALVDGTLQAAEGLKNLAVSDLAGFKQMESDYFDDNRASNVISSLGMQGFADLYQRNRGAYQATGDVVTLFSGVGAVRSGIRQGAKQGVKQGVKQSTTVPLQGSNFSETLFNIAAAPTRATMIPYNIGVEKLVASKAGKKVFGDYSIVQRQIDEMDNLAMVAPEKFRNFTDLRGSKHYTEAMQNTQKAQFKHSVKENLATEALLFASLHDSDLFFPEGMSAMDLGFMSAIGVVIPTGIDQIILNSQLRKSALSSGKAVDASRTAAGMLSTADGSSDLIANGLQASLAINAAKNLSGEAIANNDIIIGNAQRGIRRTAEKLGQQNPIETFGELKVTKANAQMMQEVITENPYALQGITGFHEMKQGTVEGLALGTTKQNLLDEAAALGKRDDLDLKDELRLVEIQRQVDEIDVTTVHGIDVDGTPFQIGQRDDTIFDDFIKIGDNNGRVSNEIGASRNDYLTPAGELKRKVKAPYQATLKDVTNSYILMPKARDTFIQGLRDAVVKKQTVDADAMLKEFTGNFGSPTKLSYLAIDYGVEVLKAIRAEPVLKDAGLLIAKEFNGNSLDNLIDAFESASLQKKYLDMKKHVAARKGKDVEITPMDLSRRYNLAMHGRDSAQASPVYDVMMNRVMRGDRNFKSYAEFEAAVRTRGAQLVGGDAVNDIAITIKGNNLDIDVDRTPMVYTLNKNVDDLQRNTSLAVAAQVLHAEKVDRTADAVKYFDGMDKGIFANTLKIIEESGQADAIRQQLRQIMGGQEGQVAVREGRGRAAATFNSVIPQDRQFRNRNVAGMAVMDAVMDVVYKSAQKQTTEMFEPYRELYRAFHNKRGKADQLSMNLYLNARGAGFDLDIADTKRIGETFIDRASTKNIDFFEKFMPKHAVQKLFEQGPVRLPDMTQLRKGVYVPVHVTKGAEEILQATNNIYKQVQSNRNVLRFGNGEEIVETTDLMLPPPFTQNKEVAVILERGSNEIVEVVFGTSEQLARDAALKATKVINESKTGAFEKSHYVATRAEVEDILPHRLNNSLAEKMYNTSGAVTADGGLMLEGMNRWMVNSMNNVAKSSVHRVFEPELRFLRQQQSMQEALAPQAIGKREQVSVFETARNVMLNNKEEATGNFVIQAQNKVDELLNAGVGFTAKQLNAASGVLQDSGKPSGKTLAKFAEEAGYEPATEAFERAGLAIPEDSVSLFRQLNGLTGFFKLRLLEPAQALLNLASLPTVLPALSSQMGKRADETTEAYRNRTGGLTDLLGTAQLQPAPSPMKTLANALHLYTSKEGTEILRRAEAAGNMYAPAVELQEHVFTRGKVVDSKFFDKAMELITKPTDWTEQFSRQISYLQGYDMFRRMGPDFTTKELDLLSNYYANRAIGDYRTVNKPQQFQGGIGSAMGLFQTFFINYWQRMGDMVEAGNKKGLVTLYGTQASMFGLEAVPGYDVYNQMWSNYDGSVAPSDMLAEQFGIETAEVMLTGGLSNIPKLFGQDGIALYSRGDTNVRQIPNITNALQVPSLNMVRQIGQGIAEYGATARAQGQLPSYNRTLEIAAGMNINRPMTGVIELINGYAVNRSGDVTVADTRSSASRIIARVMGAKTIEEERTAAMSWRHKQQQRIAQQRVNRVRRDFAAMLRGNNGIMTVEMFDRFHEKHAELLLNPETFEVWIGNLYKKSVYEPASREMLQLYKNIASGEESGYRDMRMRRLVQIMIANQNATKGAIEIQQQTGN